MNEAVTRKDIDEVLNVMKDFMTLSWSSIRPDGPSIPRDRRSTRCNRWQARSTWAYSYSSRKSL